MYRESFLSKREKVRASSPLKKTILAKRPFEYKNLNEKIILPNYEPTKCSSTRHGIIKAYAANTNQGNVRDYNEDRVSIILNIVKPQSRQNEIWPKCSFFGVYDGHGGANCADFLRDNLHQFVIREPDFPNNPTVAIRKGFEAAEKQFLGIALDSYSRGIPERSGSCAVVSLIIGDMCYIANVGDSRAIISAFRGRKIANLSHDHKPESESERIQRNGGKIYQTHAIGDDGEQIVGPIRVFPGRLSVSRTFGDIEAKLERFGGNSQVVISDPEIKAFKILHEHDFIVLGTDGIFDKLTTSDVMDTIWNDLQTSPHTNLHNMIASAAEAVLKESIIRKSTDNVTVLIVAFTTKQDEQERVELLERVRTTGSVERNPQSQKQSSSSLFKSVKNDENNPFQINSSNYIKPIPFKRFGERTYL